MANPEHLAILKQGVKAWNAWRREHPELIPDLTGIDTVEGQFASLDFAGIDLSRANASSGRLVRLFLYDANLSNANLRHTYFGLSDLRWANLQRAELMGADFTSADISFACLAHADVTDAEMGWTILGSLDLSEVKGVDTIRHWQPSVIDVQTIYDSRGRIPEVFLRGVGLPEEFIRFAGSLVGVPIVSYSCFISYSTEDQELAQRLYFDLQERGIRCWFAPHDIQGGKKIHEQIDEAIRVYDRLLLILSDASMNSEWVKTEIANARQREIREKRQMLFPIGLVPFEKIKEWKAFDADTGKDSAREIREYFIPDFSNWKDHDSYQGAFQRLLRDLKASGSECPSPAV
jgi:uncharacterized protein YjbI with pentapeptide repeats